MADCELMAMITAVACGITKCFSVDDISILAASFTQLGDTLATYLVQVELKEKRAAAIEADKNKIPNKSNNNCQDNNSRLDNNHNNNEQNNTEQKEPLEYRGEEP